MNPSKLSLIIIVIVFAPFVKGSTCGPLWGDGFCHDEINTPECDYDGGTYSHGQELFYKFVCNFTNKLVKQLLSMTVVVEKPNKMRIHCECSMRLSSEVRKTFPIRIR